MSLTTQKITAILRKAGFDAAQTHKSGQVRGYTIVSRTGFRTTKLYSTIRVMVVASTRDPNRDDRLRDGYTKALTDAGLVVTKDEYGYLNISIPV